MRQKALDHSILGSIIDWKGKGLRTQQTFIIDEKLHEILLGMLYTMFRVLLLFVSGLARRGRPNANLSRHVVRPLDENQGPSQSHDHNPWLVVWSVSKDHFTHNPRAITAKLWAPDRKCPKADSPNTTPKSCSVVTNAQAQRDIMHDRTLNQMEFQWNFYSCGSSHMIKQNKSSILSVRSAMVSQFYIRPTSKRWFLKII